MFARPICLALAALLVAAASAQQSGITVRFYEMDQDVSLVPDLVPDQSPSEVVGVTTIDLKDGNAGYLKERFLTEIDAILTVETAGEHAFRLICDDGGLLWVGGRMVVNNDGLHGAVPKDGSAKFDAGKHPLRIRHFQGGGGWALRLEWKPPGASEFALVPAGALSSEAVAYKVEKGKKRIVPPLRRGKPGDGAPTGPAHPGYRAADAAGFSPKSLGGSVTNGWLVLNDSRVAWTGGVDHPGPIMGVNDGVLRDQMLVRRADETVRVAVDGGNASVHRFQSGSGMSFAATDKVAFEVSRVVAKSNGVELEFTQPLDARCGWEAEAYHVEQWPFDAKGGAPVRDGSTVAVKSASVSADCKRVFLEVPGLKTSHV
ncbi:MAG: PA14 domain-containing protein, partial [Phycisphaerae bacterium]